MVNRVHVLLLEMIEEMVVYKEDTKSPNDVWFENNSVTMFGNYLPATHSLIIHGFFRKLFHIKFGRIKVSNIV